MGKRERARYRKQLLQEYAVTAMDLHLWAIVIPNVDKKPGPKYGIVYGLGENPSAAWRNALLILHGEAHGCTKHLIAEYRRQGWRARKILVTND